MNPTQESILRLYQSNGWKVFPVNSEKRPTIKAWKQNASLDYKSFNGSTTGRWAVTCGNGMFVVDVDAKHGASIDDVKKLGIPTDTYTVTTPTGGWHLYYKAENTSILKNINDGSLGKGIDIRSDGAYVVAPPTPEYFLHSKNKDRIISLPQDVVSKVFPTKNTSQSSNTRRANSGSSNLILEGSRNGALFSKACILRRSGAEEEEIMAHLEWLNDNRCDHPLPLREVTTICKSAMRFNPEENVAELTYNIYNPEKKGEQLEAIEKEDFFVPRSKEYEKTLDSLEETFIWEGRIPAVEPTIIYARGGEGKTTLLLSVMKDVMDKQPDSKIMWLPLEGTMKNTQIKISNMKLDSERIFLLQNKNKAFAFDFSKESERAKFDAALNKVKPKVVIIDSLRALSSKGINDKDIGDIMGHLNNIAENHKATLIYIHHANKNIEGSNINKLMGSATIDASVRAVYFLDSESQNKRVLRVVKWNLGTDRPEDIEFVQVDTWDFKFIKADQGKELKIASLLTEALRGKNGMLATDAYRIIENNLGPDISKTTKMNARMKAGLKYEQRKDDFGKATHWWVKK